MSVYYCKFCNKVSEEKQVLIIGAYKICRHCQKLMVPLGGDEVSLSQDALSQESSQVRLNHLVEAKILKQDSINLTLAECLDKLRSNPKDVEALFCMAKIYYTKNDLKLAKTYLEKALSLKPDYQDALKWQAKLNPDSLKEENIKEVNIDFLLEQVSDLIEDRLYEKAQDLLRICIKKDPSHIESRQALASVCFELGDYKHAIKQLNWLKGMIENKEYAEFNLGVAFYALQEHKRALACFKEAFSVSRDPDLSKQAQAFIDIINKKGA